MYDFIKKNVALLGIQNCKLVKDDVFHFLNTCNEKFHFIFAGPPYALNNINDLPLIITQKQMVLPGGFFCAGTYAPQRLQQVCTV